MPTSQQVSVSTDNATATTILKDKMPALSLNTPQGMKAIGPRVTFHFIADEWNKSNTYESYDVVNVDGASYVAIQPVPAGIELDNTDYWFYWADPNAQFADLKNIVESFNSRISYIEELDPEKLKTRRYISLEDYGAIGDGKTDDTSSIQAAINYAIENGCFVTCVGVKNFLVTEPIDIYGNIQMDLNGSFITCNTEVDYILKWHYDSALSTYDPKLYNGFIKNVKIIGNANSGGFYIHTAKRCYLNNIEVSNCKTGYYLAGSAELLIDGLRAFNCNTGIYNDVAYDIDYTNIYGRFCNTFVENHGKMRVVNGHAWVDTDHGKANSVCFKNFGNGFILSNFNFDTYETCISLEDNGVTKYPVIFVINCETTYGGDDTANRTFIDAHNNFTYNIYLTGNKFDGSNSTYSTFLKANSNNLNISNCKYINWNDNAIIPNVSIVPSEYATLVSNKSVFNNNILYINAVFKLKETLDMQTITIANVDFSNYGRSDYNPIDFTFLKCAATDSQYNFVGLIDINAAITRRNEIMIDYPPYSDGKVTSTKYIRISGVAIVTEE